MVPIKLIKIRQTFDRDSIIDVERVVREQLAAARWTPPSGGQVALAVGSRGIANLARIVKAVADHSDGVILINRIKPHTDYHGTYESGLVKMSVIGLGKERQASEIHRFGVYGLKELIPRAAERVLSSGKIVLGFGVVENAYEETAVIEAMAPERIMSREPELLDQARRRMPGLPIDRLDVLIVDRMGKDISGVGLDTNIRRALCFTGRARRDPRNGARRIHRRL